MVDYYFKFMLTNKFMHLFFEYSCQSELRCPSACSPFLETRHPDELETFGQKMLRYY